MVGSRHFWVEKLCNSMHVKPHVKPHEDKTNEVLSQVTKVLLGPHPRELCSVGL